MKRRFPVLAFLIALCLGPGASAQLPEIRTGDAVPRDVREMYDRGVSYLARTQSEGGDWQGGQTGPGVTGLAVMCFLASGEDPNFGQYAGNVRRALRSMISQQNAETGYFGNSMYHHGFAMLGLAEAYGAVDERNLWSTPSQRTQQRTIGQSLELAVRAAITSQKKNSLGAWRYSPDSTDADTSVAGAVLVGLLAARNAGIEVPDEAIDRAIVYFVQMTTPSGQVGYSGIGSGGESMARISIAALVYAIARRTDLDQYKSTMKYLAGRLEGGQTGHGWLEYQLYYQAQALFQGDAEAWEKWNKNLVRQLKTAQQEDGSFRGQLGPGVSTTLSLLALAVNYRFLPIYER